MQEEQDNKISHRAKKSLGQNFLTSETAVANVVNAASLSADDTVLEIGPGKGVLTAALLETGARVIAVEKDAELIDELTTRFNRALASGQFSLVEHDILTTDFSALGLADHGYVAVANLPFYITGRFLRLLLSQTPQPRKAVLILQKEVAARIVGGSRTNEKESILSISVKAYGTPSYIGTVKAGSFSPPPAVDAAIIAIDEISKARFESIDEARFFELVKAGFSQKRKQLRGNLATLAPKEAIENAFKTADIPPKTRAEDVTLEQWDTLAQALAEFK